MNKYNFKSNFLSTGITVIICILSILGMFPISDLRLFGLVLTPYRVIIPLLFCIVSFKILNSRKGLMIENNKKSLRLVYVAAAIFFVWIIYACIQLFVVDDINLRNGLKSIIELMLAAMLIYIMVVGSFLGLEIKDYFLAIKVICSIITIVALFEIIVGVHLSSSSLYNPSYSLLTHQGSIDLSNHMATTFFFNPNDCSAFIAIFLPVFFIWNSKAECIFNSIVIAIGIIILRVNDSWICLIAVLASLSMFTLLYKGKNCKKALFNKAYLIASIIVSYVLGAQITLKLTSIISKYSSHFNSTNILPEAGGGVSDELTSKLPGLNEVISEQFGGSGTSGSSRIDTYFYSVKNMLNDTFAFGYGPGNFSSYLKSAPNSNTLLPNPHCLWIEILTEYGVFIFLIFLAFLLYLYISLIRLYINNKSDLVLLAIVVDTAYVFASVAPSSFLGYSYQWIIIGISLLIVVHKNSFFEGDWNGSRKALFKH